MEGLSAYLIAFGGEGGDLQMLRLLITHHYVPRWAVQTSLFTQNKQPTNPQSKNSYFSMMLWQKAVLWPHCCFFFFELLGIACPMCQAGKAASEALADIPSMAPASWKLMICFGELQKKVACAPSPGARNWERGGQHRAHPHPGGASRQSKGGPELLRKPTFFVPFFWW